MILYSSIKYVLYLCRQFNADKMTMKNKYISKQSNEILTFFNEQDRHCFDYELAKKALPKSNDNDLPPKKWKPNQAIFLSSTSTGLI